MLKTNGLLIALLALLAFVSMIWWHLFWNKNVTGERLDGAEALELDDKATTKKRYDPGNDVHKSAKRPSRANRALENVRPVLRSLPLSAESAIYEFAERQTNSSVDAAQQASDMNDVMDEMLNRSEIPADYAETMVALFRDKSQGDVIRDFAVQHIGLYAETLNMRGKYNADASESATLRDALWDAAEETRTIVAVAAFRAIADIAAFDPRIDVNRLDSRLASCVADSSASPAARVMAAQLCGERGIVAAKSVLARIAADRSAPKHLGTDHAKLL